MISLGTALREIINGNPILQTGIHNRLLNLTQVARYLLPQVAARTKKEIQPSTLIMSLSRLQRELSGTDSKTVLDFRISNLSITSKLCVFTFAKTRETHRVINQVYGKIALKSGYITLTEGVNEITLITSDSFESVVRAAVPVAPTSYVAGLASLGVKFDERYLNVPGFLFLVLQQLYFQNINIAELASTSTELIIYLAEDDVRLAFDTIYQRFVHTASKRSEP